MITVGFLERLEEILLQRADRPDFRLNQYFDLIGGTSVGSLLAAGLAFGMSARELREVFETSVGGAFGRRRVQRWESLFDPQPLKAELLRVFGDARLDDPGLQCALCIVAKRADTQSTWLLYNHPGGQFYESNRQMRIRDVLYASAAAPLYFVPEVVDVGGEELGAFVDGGVSMANNPALQLFFLATWPSYPFRWPRGDERLMLVSLGTGTWQHQRDVSQVTSRRVWDWAREVPSMLISDASKQAQFLLQSLSHTPTPWNIDREIGDASDGLLSERPLLWYLRYNAILCREELNRVGLAHLRNRAETLRDLGDARNAPALLEVGRATADNQVRSSHLPRAFDT